MKIIFFLFILLHLHIPLLPQEQFFLDFDNGNNFNQYFETQGTNWSYQNTVSAYGVGTGCIHTLVGGEHTLMTKNFTPSNIIDTLFFDYSASSGYAPPIYATMYTYVSTNGGFNWNWVDTMNTDSLITNSHTSEMKWRSKVIPLPYGTNKVKFVLNNNYLSLYVDNIRIGPIKKEDVSIVRNLTKNGYEYGNSKPGIQIKNKGLATRSFNVELQFPELNYSKQIFVDELKSEEHKDIYFNCNLDLGDYEYEFELFTNDDTTNNYLKNNFVVVNAKWEKLPTVYGQNNTNGGAVPYSRNDTNYVFINGGYSGIHRANLYRYNLTDNSLIQLEPAPINLFNNELVIGGDYIYLPGGMWYDFDNEIHESIWKDKIFRYSIKEDKWIEVFKGLPDLGAYSCVLVRDSLLYIIGKYRGYDNPQTSFLFNTNSRQLIPFTNVKQGFINLLNLNDTLYLFYPDSVFQGIICKESPANIYWSAYDTFNISLGEIVYWGENKFIILGYSRYTQPNGYTLFYVDEGRESWIYDLNKKQVSKYLPKPKTSSSIYSASFITKTKKTLFVLGEITYFDDIYPYVLTEYQRSIQSNDDLVVYQEQSYFLNQNYPNPFNPSTLIKYSIANSEQVVIKVFNILGKEVQVLVNEVKPAGAYQLQWNAENLPSGIYFYQMNAGSYKETKKMILLR
ncbi:MAG: T9SS type A sorting domain-containing protein [Syntrophothermus sp.]